MIRLKVPGTEFMRRAVKEAERASERAQKRTLRKTTKWAAKEGTRQITRANRIPLRAMRRRPWEKRQGKAGRMRWTIEDEQANAWIGTLPIRSAYLGTLSQNSRSARAGQHRFPGGFIAKMPTTEAGRQHRGIFRRAKDLTRRTKGRPRTSSANLPIIEERVFLENAEQVEKQVGAELPGRYREILRQESRFEEGKWERRFG